MNDLHVHTTYCDGANTPEEIVLAAIAKGLDTMGFSGHSYTAFDTSYCMSPADTARYKREVRALREKYRGKIKILLGVEQDYYSSEPTGDYDYVIGSVHYLRLNGAYLPVDESADRLREAVSAHCGGDFYTLAELYFRTVADVARKTRADIIGHFDLIAKFNEGGALFDENHPRYVAAWRAALDALLPAGKPFELNTGALARGLRTDPYPAAPIRAEILARGGALRLTSDCHRADRLCYAFERFK